MAVLLMILLMISPFSSLVMIIRQYKHEKCIFELKKDIEHINEINSLINDNIMSVLDNINNIKSSTMESISTNESK